MIRSWGIFTRERSFGRRIDNFYILRMERRRASTTIKSLQNHEKNAIHPVGPQVDGLRSGASPEHVFSKDDSRKREFYALLAIVLERAWHGVAARVQDPRTEASRYLYYTQQGPLEKTRDGVESMIDKSISFAGAVDVLFEHYQALLRQELTRLTGDADPSDPVFLRLKQLMLDGVHSVSMARDVVQEVMAGVGTARKAISFVVAYTPEIFFRQFHRVPSSEEWVRILENSESFLLVVASKQLERFRDMGAALSQPEGAIKRHSSDIWNEYRFCIEGDGSAMRLGIDKASLALLDEWPSSDTGDSARVGCPALYARTEGRNVIQALYRSFLRDVEVYLVPRYAALARLVGDL